MLEKAKNLDRKQKVTVGIIAVIYILALANTFIELDGDPPLWQQDNVYLQDFEQTNSSCLTGNTTLNVKKQKVSDRNYRLEIDGSLKTSNPCHTLNAELEKVNRTSFNLRVTSEPKETGGCIDCIGEASYSAVLKTRIDSFRLNIIHDGEKVRTVSTES